MTETLNPLRGTQFIRVVGAIGAALGFAVLAFYLVARIRGDVVSPEQWTILKSNHGPWHYDWGWVLMPILLMSIFAVATSAMAGVLLAISNRSTLPLRSGAVFAILNLVIFFGVAYVVSWVFE